MGPAISDYNMRLILLSGIQLSGGHCNYILEHVGYVYLFFVTLEYFLVNGPQKTRLVGP
jgi:hypothetical protein